MSTRTRPIVYKAPFDRKYLKSVDDLMLDIDQDLFSFKSSMALGSKIEALKLLSKQGQRTDGTVDPYEPGLAKAAHYRLQYQRQREDEGHRLRAARDAEQRAKDDARLARKAAQEAAQTAADFIDA